MSSTRARRGLVPALCIAVAACSSSDASVAGTTATTVAASTAAATSDEATDASGHTVAGTTAVPIRPTAPTTDSTTTSPPPPSTSEPATGTTAPDDPALTDDQLADIELARSALLTIDVFPAGWTEEPDVDDAEVDVVFEQRFDECLGRSGDSVTDQLDDVEAESGDFTGPGDNPPSVQHSVTLAPDEATAVLAMSELALEGAAECLEDVVQDFFEQQLASDPDVPDELRIGEVRIDVVDTGESTDTSLGYTIEIPLELGEQRGAQYLELLYQRRGRALSSLEFSSFGAPFDRDGYRLLGDEAAVRLDSIGG